MVEDARCVATPPLLADDPVAGRLLLGEVPGVDQHYPDESLTVRMVETLVTLQQRMMSRREAVLASGAADWRATALSHSATDLAARGDVRAELDLVERAALDAVIAELPARLDALYSCGLQDTLIHGDFHPGNHRFDGHRLVLLDWGDSGVGHPLLDMAAFLERVPAEWQGRVRTIWVATWTAMFPRSEVALAVELIQPVAALRQAIIYRRFLDAIELSEQIYHRDDPARWLRRAIALTGA
jgi:aminoglycoside phosphotransferase (APT) family kinase protein